MEDPPEDVYVLHTAVEYSLVYQEYNGIYRPEIVKPLVHIQLI